MSHKHLSYHLLGGRTGHRRRPARQGADMQAHQFPMTSRLLQGDKGVVFLAKDTKIACAAPRGTGP